MSVAIGILSSHDDIHAIAVKQKIAERHPEVRCHVIAGKELATKGGLSWSNDVNLPSVLRTTDDELVEIERLDAFWYRRLTMHQLLPEAADPEYAEHIHTSCWTALQGHLMTEFSGFWVSDPVATELGENKLLQLRAAQRAGMRIPATLVSQDPARIRSFCGDHPCAIIKPLRARGELAVTAVASAELLTHDDVLALAPAIYQENIRGDRHLRITMFGDRCHAAVIEARELDWRTDVTVPFRPYDPSAQLRAAMQGVLRMLGLVMGIFDLKLTPDGDVVFLEINPQGQFLFVEGLCNIPITASLADYLVERAHEHAAKRGAEYL